MTVPLEADMRIQGQVPDPNRVIAEEGYQDPRRAPIGAQIEAGSVEWHGSFIRLTWASWDHVLHCSKQLREIASRADLRSILGTSYDNPL